MISTKNTSVIIITLFLSLMVIVGRNFTKDETFTTERENLITNINSSINQEILSNNDNKFDSIQEKPQRNWGFSFVEYNPHTGIVSNSTIKNGEMVEFNEALIK